MSTELEHTLAAARAILVRQGWKPHRCDCEPCPHWLADPDGPVSICEAIGLAKDRGACGSTVAALAALDEELGRDFVEWEHESGRTVDDVLALIDRALPRIYPDGPRKGYVSPMP